MDNKFIWNDGDLETVQELPEAKFGDAESKDVDWRASKDLDNKKDDDEELAKTPEDVVAMLGFDPLEMKQEATLDAISDSVDRMVKLGERFLK